MGKQVRIGVSGSYGGMNIGDEAILHSILDQLRTTTRCEVVIFSHDPEDTQRRHAVDRAIKVRDLTRDEARKEVSQLDLFILGGGGILYDRDAEAYLREVALANELGVPVVVYAISAGPLANPDNRRIVARHLNNASVVTVRDRQAQKLLEDVGVEREILLTADPALLLRPENLAIQAFKSEGIDFEKRLVGFSVREPGPAAPDIDVTHYHSLLANAADFIVDRYDVDILFVPMERKKMDVQHSHAVVAQMQCAQRATVLKGEYGARELLSLVGHFEFAVGMRLHFLIFAALQNVPFVALPYASKVAGFIEDLDMPMPPLKQVTIGRLVAHIDRSWDMRQELRTRIANKLPEIQERARQTNQLVLQTLSQPKPSTEQPSAMEAT